jgi:hypothetical protein
MMKAIYQRAGLVIIWLGEELTTDPEALRLAMNIRNFINGNQEVPVDIFGTIDHEASGIPRAGSPSWRSLMLLYGQTVVPESLDCTRVYLWENLCHVVWNARIRPGDPDAACTSAFSVSTAGEDYCVFEIVTAQPSTPIVSTRSPRCGYSKRSSGKESHKV